MQVAVASSFELATLLQVVHTALVLALVLAQLVLAYWLLLHTVHVFLATGPLKFDFLREAREGRAHLLHVVGVAADKRRA